MFAQPHELSVNTFFGLGVHGVAIRTSSLAYGRLNRFQDAQMMAHNSVLRDATNPFAYEALGLSLACNGHTDDANAAAMSDPNRRASGVFASCGSPAQTHWASSAVLSDLPFS
jgi:hypothetical protein